VTVARYLTPSGRDIQHQGIADPTWSCPSRSPSIPEGEDDSWLEQAAELLKQDPGPRHERPHLPRSPARGDPAGAPADPAEALAIALIDTAPFQRLRRIRQLGPAFLTFHGAESSRFTHSLGVLHLARLALAQLARQAPRAGRASGGPLRRGPAARRGARPAQPLR
jgi:hypothetical protein